jgi:predicted PurR-regulated permease PerM
MNYPFIVLVDEEKITPTSLDVSDSTHVYLYFTYIHSSHTLTIISSKTLYLYNELLDKYAKLQINFGDLNSTYHELLNNQSTLLSSYTQLLERDNALNASYQEWLLDYSELQANYTSLLSEHEQNIRSLTYVFIATTTILIMAAAYLQHTHSVYTEVEKRVNRQVIDPKGYMHM